MNKCLTSVLLCLLCLTWTTAAIATTTEGQQEQQQQQALEGKELMKSLRKKMALEHKAQRDAVNVWATTLTAADYDINQWPTLTKQTQPQHIFDFYTQKLTDVFQQTSSLARVNFVLVGACDGTHDKTIQTRFLPNNNWNGVFVEPIGMNYRDLVSFLTKINNAIERSFTIKAAVTDVCATPTVVVKVAKYEEKNPESPHWLRREIGAIVSGVEEVKRLGKNWDAETVPCYTAEDIFQDWYAQYRKKMIPGGNPSKKSKKAKNPRVHILKIDAEGHDYQVLSSFLTTTTTTSPDSLPLLICFEAKSMKENLPAARQLLVQRGYIVSEGNTNDGFAILRVNSTTATTSTSAKETTLINEETEGEQQQQQDGETPKKRRKRRKSKD